MAELHNTQEVNDGTSSGESNPMENQEPLVRLEQPTAKDSPTHPAENLTAPVDSNECKATVNPENENNLDENVKNKQGKEADQPNISSSVTGHEQSNNHNPSDDPQGVGSTNIPQNLDEGKPNEGMDHSTLSSNHDTSSTETDTNLSSSVRTQKRKSGSKASSHTYRSGAPYKPEISYIEDDEPDLLDSVFANAKDPKLIDRLLGCVYGQALGDAYGLSTEFEDRTDVERNYPDPEKIIPFPDYKLTHHSRRWTRGDWTDDTDQWILILETLSETNGDEKLFAKKLNNWINDGYSELGDWAGLGLGANVSQVVHSHNFLEDPHKASEDVWERGRRYAAPNGAVMRCSASAFYHFRDIDKVISTTTAMCKVTHFDPRCISSCLAVCLAITDLLSSKDDVDDIELIAECAQNKTIEILSDTFPSKQCEDFKWHIHKDRTLEELNLDEPKSIGYTYKCLGSGFYGLRSTRSFEKTLNDLIRFGGDADTNGAVCGTMYGARHGYKKLPYKWLRAMPFKKWLDEKIIKCLKQMNLLNDEPMETQSSSL